jgi:geranylgeranyl pyrophosphate synthase
MGAEDVENNDAFMLASLGEVRALMARSLSATTIAAAVDEWETVVGAGKMLRARLGFRVGVVLKVPHQTLVHAAAAVEMIHAASLLHDDVIDGGALRRGAPTFWVERGVPAAILLGDLLLFKALDLTCDVESAWLTPALIRATGNVCEAEAEQELVLRGSRGSWDTCVSIARRKTGALFGFIALVCGGENEKLRDVLAEAGRMVGTAYQLADDILDANGDPKEAGKTLGSDRARAKTTAVSATRDLGEALDEIDTLCRQAAESLAPWPAVAAAWNDYMARDFRPALDRNLACFTT